MINFFTIVHNGMPFIQYHLPVFQKLRIPWRWVIVEGISKHGSDRGGVQPNLTRWHKDFLSIDGTSEYLDRIKDDRVRVVRYYCIWQGKTDMVNIALGMFRDGDVLWEVDCDENWKPEQIEKMALMFKEHPDKTSALFCCRFFVGPDRFIFEPGKTGNMMAYEWRRAWRYVPGAHFSAHEPPTYNAIGTGTHPTDFTHAETMKEGLIFDHMWGVTEEQMRFKEAYYGCPGMVGNWKRLQTAALPVRFRDYLPYFCRDDAKVVKA